jgi:hypothetical protein
MIDSKENTNMSSKPPMSAVDNKVRINDIIT